MVIFAFPRWPAISHRAETLLVPIVRDIMMKETRNAWLAELEQAGIPCAAIRTVAEVCESAVLRKRGMIAEMPHPTAGVVKGVKSPIHMSATPLRKYAAPPRLGEHTDEILTNTLKLDEKMVVGLRAKGVI